MKTISLIALLAAGALCANAALAVDEHHPDQPAPAAAQTVEKTVPLMRTNVKLMQEQLDKIGKTKDPKERMKLMQEHMQTMQENMRMGQAAMADEGGMGMMGGGMGMMGMKGGKGMMDCPMMGGGMAQGGPSSDMMMNRMQSMEKRMDLMQMMLEQLSRQQTPMPAK